MARRPRLLLCGPSQCGKDTAAEFLRDAFGYLFRGSSSQYLRQRMVAAGYDAELLAGYRHRPEVRDQIYQFGKQLRETRVAALVGDVSRENELFVGFRELGEVQFMQRYQLVDLTLWIDRDVPPDPTLEYGPEVADLILPNRGTIQDLFGRLALVARVFLPDWPGRLLPCTSPT